MEMDDFAAIIKQSRIAGKNKADIIFILMQAAGAKRAVSESSQLVSNQSSNEISSQSPSKSTIQKWLGGKEAPRTSTYFPIFKIEAKETALRFLRDTPKKGQWKELRDLFRKWYEDHPNKADNFYINTETEDFVTFSACFWRQFASFFSSLRIWDGAEEQESGKKRQENPQNSMAREILDIFRAKFGQYRVYEFVPRSIEEIIDSLHIHYDILRESARTAAEDNGSDHQTVRNFKKMYCKWFPECDCFEIHAAVPRKRYWELKTAGESVLLDFGEHFEPNAVQTDIWLEGEFRYATVSQEIPEDQLDVSTLTWKECHGEIVVVSVELPSDEGDLVMEDCHVVIDGMLESAALLDRFAEEIDGKIITKYENVTCDNDSRRLYNDMKQYRKVIKKFKTYLTKFRNLQKVKSRYFCEQALIETFGMYQSFSHFEAVDKPRQPFAECYLEPEKAEKVESSLCFYHENLMELYEAICSWEEKCYSGC